ncbi:serine/threonine-protein kinase [Arthrobacter sp. fls2-241-R2A-200]|uniref:serine/threonine-protein kinase n=1 Tax=Arthrobacter sp. fls2-241-R2A-200 TaxID=3040281 RepID=UPI00254BE338|nr:serine/threonine-protein kinase [Arthrobacter sp. fls2-241-R2A-200]
MDNVDSAAGAAPILPGYSVSRRLGQGGQSSVWLATRDRDRFPFAVKYSRAGTHDPDSAGNAGDLDAVLGEARLLSRVQHDHLVRIHDVLEINDDLEPGPRPGTALAVVMDYAAGGSLANLVASRGKLTIGETVTVLVPVAQVLSFLHAQGIVHGDVSPGNVLFSASGKPLLADLGLARVLGGSERDSDVGTAGFIDVPEAARRQEPYIGALRPHRDIYSLGALAWFCLTGRSPESTMHRPPLSLLVPDVPKALASVVESALNEDPSARPEGREFATAVFRTAAPEPLDLSGVVHSSVLPDLVTSRQAVARSGAMVSSVSRLLLRFRSLPLSRGLPQWRSLSQSLSRTPVAGAGRRIDTDAKVGTKQEGAEGRPVDRRRRHLQRRWYHPRSFRVMLGLLVAAVLTVGTVAWASAQGDRFPAREPQASALQTGAAAESKANGIPELLETQRRSEDPVIAVQALSALRDLALSQQRPELLGLVNAPGSTAQSADSALAARLANDGTRLTGLTTAVTDAAVVGTPRPDDAVVTLTTALSGYQETTGAGVVVATHGAGSRQHLRLHLVRSANLWYVADVEDPLPGG